MDTFQLDTLDWVRLRCAACGQGVEILRLDFEASGGVLICSPCCGVKLVPLDDVIPSPASSDSLSTSRADVCGSDVEFSEALPEAAALPHDVSAERSGETTVVETSARTTAPRLKLTIPSVAPDDVDPAVRASVWGGARRSSASVAVSVAVHAILLLLLAAIVFHLPPQRTTDVLNVSFEVAADKLTADASSESESTALDEAVSLTHSTGQSSGNSEQDPAMSPVAIDAAVTSAPSSASTSENFIPSNRNGRIPTVVKVTPDSGLGGQIAGGGPDGGAPGSATGSSAVDDWGIPVGMGFQSRRPQTRRLLAALSGATPASEAAVRAGLNWLVAHQREDGAWSLQHTHAECGEACLPNSSMDCPTAATGLALLCFLGAGHSHVEGDYQPVVKRGLDWLVAQSRDGDLRMPLTLQAPEGRSAMYAQGAAAMALCEAYGMTLDRTLIQPCEEATEFIAESQDPVGGGWRYTPQEPGDTSVAGWQVMALVSARLSGLEVPAGVRDKLVDFLKSVHTPRTGEFGYIGTQRSTLATTAIGNLCNLYLHSTLERGDLQRIARSLGAQDPRQNNEYANYYVSLVLHQFGGEHWRLWNAVCRDTLVATQQRQGHAAGSWDPTSNWGRSGGRLYSTCMNVLTLEVYYRHLPLYAEHAFEIGLAAKPVSKKRKAASKAGKPSSKAAAKNDATQPGFVPITTDEPIEIAASEGVVEGRQMPLVIKPLRRQQSIFPHATRFCTPLRNLFEEATLRTVTDSNGQQWRQYPDSGFGMPLIKVGEQTLVHTGGDFGWFQPNEPVFAVAAGIVRYSGGPEADGVEPLAAAGWGNIIVIEHQLPGGSAVTTIYAHLGIDRQVEVGDIAAAGQLIGSIGQQSATINGDCVPHLFFAIRPGAPDAEETSLAAFAVDANDWLDPIAFLREQQADVLPAIRFSPTWNPFPRSNPDIIGQSARDWSVGEWLRPPRQGREVSDMKGKTICLVCVQSSCEASRLLGGLLLHDLAEQFQNAPDVVLVLLQTATGNFKENSVPILRNSIAGFPENVAIGHVSAANGPPLMLDRYGIRATPWTVLIRGDGTIAGAGVMVDSTEVARLIESLRQAGTAD